MEVDLSDRPVDVISEGYDVVLRIGVLEDSSLIARRIALIDRVYCASPAYLAERGTPQKPKTCTPMIACPMATAVRRNGVFKGRRSR